MSTVYALRGAQAGNSPQPVIDIFYDELKKGKARFAYDAEGKSLRDEVFDGKLAFLLRIKPNDWVVYVNMPQYGHCVAAKVIKEYEHDEGKKVDWGAGEINDLGHYVTIDPDTITKPFNRRDPNVDRSLYWDSPGRAWRLNAEAFFRTLENFDGKKYDGADSNAQLKDVVKEPLKQMTSLIQQKNAGRRLEEFLVDVFGNMPHVTGVDWNGKGGRDDGADLIVEFKNPISELSGYKLIVQVKSYVGEINSTHAIDQVVKGIKNYDGSAGLIFTTAEATKQFDDYRIKISEAISKPIDIIAGEDVARFVLRYAPRDVL